MYTIYKVINKLTKEIVYIGQTKDKLKYRLNRHIHDISSAIYKLAQKIGKENLEIEPIIENIETSNEANNLENKTIVEYSQKYNLLNRRIITYTSTIENIRKKSKNKRKNFRQVKCIETGEIFDTGADACRKYQIASSSLYKALNNNTLAGIDKEGNGLHWEYVDGKKKVEEKINKVYIIEQLIDNVWIPIYIGSTYNSLSKRLQGHYHIKTGTLYEVLHKCPKEDFRIRCLEDNIIDKETMYQKEYEYTLEYMEQYKLYNKYIGNHVTDEYKEYFSKLFTGKSNGYHPTEKQCKAISERQKGGNGPSAKRIILLNTGKEYNCIKEASEILGLSQNVIIDSCKFQRPTNSGLDFRYLDYSKKVERVYKVFVVYKDGNPYYVLSKYMEEKKQEYLINLCGYSERLKTEMKEIGVEHFSYKFIKSFKTKEEAKKKEIKLIRSFMKKYQLINTPYFEGATEEDYKYLRHKDIVPRIITDKIRESYRKSWEDEEIRNKRLEGIHKTCGRKVKCTTTGEIFDTVIEASKHYSISRNSILNACSGEFEYAGRSVDGKILVWEYVDNPQKKKKEKAYTVYDLIYENKIVRVLVSSLPEKEILSQILSDRGPVTMLMKEVGKDKFILKSLQAFKGSDEAKLYKKKRIEELKPLNTLLTVK